MRNSQEPVAPMANDIITHLRAVLARRALRAALAIAALLFVLAIIYFVSVQLLWAVPLAFLALVLMLVGGLVSLPLRTRVWAAVIASLLAGTIDLVVRGRMSDAGLYYLVAVALAALVLRAKVGYGVLAAATLLLLSFAGLAGAGLPVPLVETGAPPTLPMPTVASSLLLFAAFGFSLTTGMGFLFGRSEDSLREEEQRYATLSDDYEAVQDSFATLQESNARLQRRVSQLEASQSVAQLLATVFELGALLNRAAELISEHFGIYHVGIFLIDESGDWVVLNAASSTTGKEMVLHSYRLPVPGRTVVGRVSQYCRPYILDATDDVDDIDYAMVSQLPATRSEMALPMMVDDRLIGVLDFHSRNEGAFEEEDMRTLEGLAAHLALAVHNARRLSDEASVLEAASPFYRTANRLATARTEKEVYSVIVETLRDFSPARLLIVRSSARETGLKIVADMQGERIAFTEQDLSDLRSPGLIDVILMGLSLENPLWVADLTDLDGSLSPELGGALEGLMETSDVAGLAFVPVRMEGHMAEGGVAILYSAVHQFTAMERRLHQLLAELGGAALERSQLLTQARVRLEREQLLSTVGDRLRASFDPDVIMQTTVRELGRLLGAERTSIEINPPADASTTDAGSRDVDQDGSRDSSQG